MKFINRQIFYLIHRPIGMGITKRCKDCEGYIIFVTTWRSIK